MNVPVMGVVVGGGALILSWLFALRYRNKYKKLRTAFGRAVTELVEKGGDDGLLAIDTHDQDIDFRFIPTLNREKGLYYIEGKDGERHYIKVKKKEIHFLRGRFPTIFLVNDKIRAVDLELVKTLNLLDKTKRAELLADWSRYVSLKKGIDELEEELKFVDESTRDMHLKLIQELRKELKELEKKWNSILIELDANKALAIYDPEEKTVSIIKTLNLSEFVDHMTGVYRDEIEDIVRAKLNRKLEGILRDITERLGAFRIPEGSETSDVGKYVGLAMMVFFIALIGLIIIRAIVG